MENERMNLNVPLLVDDMVEVYTAAESKELFGITFNSNWRNFIERKNHVFHIKKFVGDEFETAFFTAEGTITIECKYIKRLVSRDKTPEDENKWLTQK